MAAWQRQVLVTLERTLASRTEAEPALALVAAEELPLDEAALNAARRRALFVLAAGGDPTRALDADAPVAARLADEVRALAPAGSLTSALRALEPAAHGLPLLAESLRGLVADEDRAWRTLACAYLAEELGG